MSTLQVAADDEPEETTTGLERAIALTSKGAASASTDRRHSEAETNDDVDGVNDARHDRLKGVTTMRCVWTTIMAD